MKTFFLILLAFVPPVFGDPPIGYYDGAFGKTGTELKTALHEIINDHVSFPYSGGATNTADALSLLDEDPANTNNVILLYAQRSEPKNTFGLTTGWNREHVWPNSYGLDDVRPAYTDLFNLRAEDANVNSARGNKYYDISDHAADSYKQPAHVEAPFTSTDFDSWEPPDAVKGDIARALFYMDVRYEGSRTNEPDLVLKDNTGEIGSATNFMGRLTTVLLWHELDPVDDAERLRNDRIYQFYQKNRNPFIDHPEWVAEIFLPKMRIELTGEQVQVFWPVDYASMELYQATNASGPWTISSGLRTMVGDELRQTEDIQPGRTFFKLKAQ